MNLMPSFQDNSFRPLRLLGMEVPIGQRAGPGMRRRGTARRGFLPFFLVVFNLNLKTHVLLES